MNTTYPPAGWYTDPSSSSRERYWDGNSWGNDTRPMALAGAGSFPAAPPAAPAAPNAPMAYSQPYATASSTNAFSIAGIILGAIAFLFFPIILGPIGIVLGAIAKSKGEAQANTALIVSGVGTVAGMFLGAMAWLMFF